MKKLIAALLVLTLVLGLSSTAFAACKPTFVKGQIVEFKVNAKLYNCKDGKATKAIVKKGSTAVAAEDSSDGWVKLYIDLGGEYEDAKGNIKYQKPRTRWFKTADLKKSKGYKFKYKVDGKKVEIYLPMYVVYCQGGKGMSNIYYGPFNDKGDDQISKSCYKHVKATKGSVWLHKNPCLTGSVGIALSKGKKATYKRVWGYDERGMFFFKVKYNGKTGFVSSAYTEIVK